jgi:hypothetical protein
VDETSQSREQTTQVRMLWKVTPLMVNLVMIMRKERMIVMCCTSHEGNKDRRCGLAIIPAVVISGTLKFPEFWV